MKIKVKKRLLITSSKSRKGVFYRFFFVLTCTCIKNLIRTQFFVYENCLYVTWHGIKNSFNICRGSHPIKLLCNFIEITLRHGCSPIHLLHIFRTPFLKNTSEWMLLYLSQFSHRRIFKTSKRCQISMETAILAKWKTVSCSQVI